MTKRNRRVGIGPLLDIGAILAFALSPVVWAQSSRYWYDDTGQLFRAVDGQGNLLEWRHDAAGNITEIRRSTLRATDLTILNFTPRRALAGEQIVIEGQNFSSVASENRVTFNGVVAQVVSASANRLVVVVPPGAGGEVAVTVRGQTVSSGQALLFSSLLLPRVSSVNPDRLFAGQTADIAVQGERLDGAIFEVSGNGAEVVAVSGASSTAASVQIAAGTETGDYHLLATTGLGTSEPATENRIMVLSATGTFEQQYSILNLGGPSGTILDAPLYSTLNLAGASGEVYEALPIYVQNDLFPAGSNTASTGWVSVRNTASGVTLSVPLRPEPSVRVSSARGPGRESSEAAKRTIDAIVGQTLVFDINGAEGEAMLELNGSAIGPPVTGKPLLFTVPAGSDRLQLRVNAGLDVSALVEVRVREDAGRTLRVKVTDDAGNPLKGQAVTVRMTGLQAEYFDSKEPLTALIDLGDRKADRTGFISALNYLNLSGVMGADPFGAGMAPDYSARFRSDLLVEASGEHRFFLTSHAAARLSIDGAVVAEVPFAAAIEVATGAIHLAAGRHRIEVLHVAGVGLPALRLEWENAGSGREVVPPLALSPVRAWSGVTGEDGVAEIAGVPASIEVAGVQVSCADQCKVVME